MNFKFIAKIFLAIALALLVSAVFYLFNEPKVNQIPILPSTMRVELSQVSISKVELKSVTLVEQYPSDYQSGLARNYYSIYLKNADTILFTGKTPKSYVIFEDDFSTGTAEGRVERRDLNNFTLNLPYYKDAQELILVDDLGKQVLSVDLTKYALAVPASTKKTCGDGICADDENSLSCFKDCPFLK